MLQNTFRYENLKLLLFMHFFSIRKYGLYFRNEKTIYIKISWRKQLRKDGEKCLGQPMAFLPFLHWLFSPKKKLICTQCTCEENHKKIVHVARGDAPASQLTNN